MLEIDGSLGEGGGQVLRTSLALSVLTRQPFHITNIRARRSKPGLRPQHLKSVDAAAAISKAEVRGAAINSPELIFQPQDIRTGRYKFDIGTAGSTSLVLQTIFLPLALASSASSVIINGGTHVNWAPCTHYLLLQWLPHLKMMGFDAHIALDRAGFYPEGNGRITATIRPVGYISPLELIQRGNLRSIHGISAVANLDLSIAERQKRQAMRRLLNLCQDIHIKVEKMPARFKGTCLVLCADFEPEGTGARFNCCYYGLGARGKPAERVADEAVDALLAFLETGSAIDQYLADQLLLPMSLARGSSAFTTSKITPHLITNAAVIQAFTQTQIEIDGEPGEPGFVRLTPQDEIALKL